MKAKFFLAALGLTATVSGAQASSAAGPLCEAMANVARDTATRQLEGMSQEAFLIKYAPALNRMQPEIASGHAAKDCDVYANEWSPTEARRIIWTTCLKVF